MRTPWLAVSFCLSALFLGTSFADETRNNPEARKTVDVRGDYSILNTNATVIQAVQLYANLSGRAFVCGPQVKFGKVIAFDSRPESNDEAIAVIKEETKRKQHSHPRSRR